MKKELDLVLDYQKELTLYSQIAALLDWDQKTYMPKKGISGRAEQLALISKISHEKMISGEFYQALRKLSGKVKNEDARMVAKLLKDVEKSRKLSKDFVEELARATTLANNAWEQAREKKDYGIFEPHLAKIISLKRKQADLIGLPGHKYNSLLDDFEEGMTAERIQEVFSVLKEEIKVLLSKIKNSEKYKKQKLVLLAKEFPKEKQEILVKDVCARMGLEKESSRIDLSEHPFTTTMSRDDVRITTAYRKKNMFAFESSVHEAGHALYELGLPERHRYDILGGTPSLGIHESQSRFWENMIAKSKPFWNFYFPKFDKEFKLSGNKQKFYDEINMVLDGPIRIESDEVHYPLHVILRFELEMDLISGKIGTKNLDKIWSDRFSQLFGFKPKDDVQGVLQDVHWSIGAIGYFPTYALGTIYSAQLFEAMSKDFDVARDIQKGDFSKIRAWLREKVHRHGSKMMADEIIMKATGNGLNVKPYVDYLNKKYGAIYGF